jgi:hypothetical protein
MVETMEVVPIETTSMANICVNHDNNIIVFEV